MFKIKPTTFDERLETLFYSHCTYLPNERLDDAIIPKIELDKFLLRELTRLEFDDFDSESFEMDAMLSLLIAMTSFIRETQLISMCDKSYENERNIAHRLMTKAYYDMSHFIHRRLAERQGSFINQLIEDRYERRGLEERE